MEPAAGQPGQNPDPRSSPPPRRALDRHPLSPRPAGRTIRSYPAGMQPASGPDGKPKLLPMDAPEPRRRINRVGFYLAIAIGLGTIPFTWQFWKNRAHGTGKAPPKTDYSIPMEKRAWRMRGIVDNTEKQVVDRFGPPLISRNYNMSDGAFVGPLVGQKHFYAKTLPDYEARTADKEDTVVWTYPHYLVIREVVWQFPDSFLTIWMREPRAEIDLTNDKGVTSLPPSTEGGGDWVVIDNFRLGKDLVKNPPATPPPATPAPTPVP